MELTQRLRKGSQRCWAVRLVSRGFPKITLAAREAARYHDLLHGGELMGAENGALTVDLPPLWGRVLLAA